MYVLFYVELIHTGGQENEKKNEISIQISGPDKSIN
jgi:hypothetical protein